jgi:hypothetical protein
VQLGPSEQGPAARLALGLFRSRSRSFSLTALAGFNWTPRAESGRLAEQCPRVIMIGGTLRGRGGRTVTAQYSWSAESSRARAGQPPPAPRPLDSPSPRPKTRIDSERRHQWPASSGPTGRPGLGLRRPGLSMVTVAVVRVTRAVTMARSRYPQLELLISLAVPSTEIVSLGVIRKKNLGAKHCKVY